ncbi:MAG: hypothetical protein JOY69_03155 [Candidatus Eremiobacteraeota bacterium]|nr:hypothetical protein [Candidatus Eremiobacteraeota bacterium]
MAACRGNNPGINALPIPNSPAQAGAFLRGGSGVTRVYQPDWAGPVLFAPAEKPLQIPTHRFASVEGEWIVPSALPTINCSNPKEQTDGSSLWIALDGWSATFKAHYKKNGQWHTYDSTDILQAGSESDVPCYHGGPLRNYRTSAYFWIEWSGTKNVAVEPHHRTNLPLKAGDEIYVRIAATTTGPRAWRQATLWFVNETTGFVLPPRTFRSGCIDCGTPYQRPATLFGNTVEWITEATFYSSLRRSLPNTLDDFGNVAMSHAIATDQNGASYDPAVPNDATPNLDWMTWNGVPLDRKGTLLACSAILGPREITFARAPYVISTPGQQGDLEPKPQRCR